jgi:hypothetical protein
MRFLVATLVLLGAASPAGGQIIRAPSGDPPWIITGTIGFLHSAETIFDGSTGSVWDFGSAVQYRVSLERRVAERVGIGLSLSQANVPLVYSLSGSDTPSTTSCAGPSSVRCDATTDLTTVALSLSAGGDYGLHQILQIGIGVSFFDNFTEDGTGQHLAPLSGDKDFHLAVGYGIGYGISNRLSFSLVQDAWIILHQRTGLAGNRDSFHQLLVTRLGLRLALGR